MGFEANLEVVKAKSKEENGRNDQRELKNINIGDSHDHVKISHDYAKWTKGGKSVAI